MCQDISKRRFKGQDEKPKNKRNRQVIQNSIKFENEHDTRINRNTPVPAPQVTA